MIVDGRSLEDGTQLNCQVCIVGAGVAGISLALELQDAGLDVVVLESGGLEPDRATQSLYEGEIIGHPYYPLETARARQFAGSSNRWLLELNDGSTGARLYPLDSIDFESRPWVEHSGWPFGLNDLMPFYRRANQILEISSQGFCSDQWKPLSDRKIFEFSGNDVFTRVYQHASRDVFRDSHRRDLEKSESSRVYLYTNALKISVNDDGSTAKYIYCGCLDGPKFTVSADSFVLAAGAIEIPRLLLLSNEKHPSGLGNSNDVVGRYFMEHPHLWSGFIEPSHRSLVRQASFYSLHDSEAGVPIIGQLGVSEEAQQEFEMLNYSVALKPAPRRIKKRPGTPFSSGLYAIRGAGRALLHGDMDQFARHLSSIVPVAGEVSIRLFRRAMRISRKIIDLRQPQVFLLNHMAEQAPNPNSRVTLSDDLDRLGQKTVRLDWRLTNQDIWSIFKAQQVIGCELERAGLGSLVLEMDGKSVPPDIHGGWHHMGTTRIHSDPKKGVVDENCRVHGIHNLYIAGPSVFPTSGSANPTYTIVALAIRLADRLKRNIIGRIDTV